LRLKHPFFDSSYAFCLPLGSYRFSPLEDLFKFKVRYRISSICNALESLIYFLLRSLIARKFRHNLFKALGINTIASLTLLEKFIDSFFGSVKEVFDLAD